MQQNDPIETISKNVHDDQGQTKGQTNPKLVSGLKQFSVMFRKPHLNNSILVYVIQFGILFG